MIDAATSIVVPPEYAVRLTLQPPQVTVVIAPPGVSPTPEGVAGIPMASAMLTHDAGLSWPNQVGVAIARRMLAAGGSVLLVFASLADALACHQRLTRERVQ